MSEILSNGTENNSLHNIDHCISIYVSYGIRKGPFAIMRRTFHDKYLTKSCTPNNSSVHLNDI